MIIFCLASTFLQVQLLIAFLPTDGTTEEARMDDRIVRKCSPFPANTTTHRCHQQDSQADFLGVFFKGLLSEILGYPYNGEVTVSGFRGQICEDCCESNTNIWSADYMHIGDD